MTKTRHERHFYLFYTLLQAMREHYLVPRSYLLQSIYKQVCKICVSPCLLNKTLHNLSKTLYARFIMISPYHGSCLLDKSICQQHFFRKHVSLFLVICHQHFIALSLIHIHRIHLKTHYFTMCVFWFILGLLVL